jgi:hypothetical protein
MPGTPSTLLCRTEGVLAWSQYLGMKEVFAYLNRSVSERRSPKLRMPNFKDLMGMGGHKSKRVLAGGEGESSSSTVTLGVDRTPRSPSQHSQQARPSSLHPASARDKSTRPTDDVSDSCGGRIPEGTELSPRL